MSRTLTIACSLVLVACRQDPGLQLAEAPVPYLLELPPGHPHPPLDPENPFTRQSVELGRSLFFDTRLSRDGSLSCASCHAPSLAFSDSVALSIGVEGRLGERNSPSLGNVAYHPHFFRDGGVPSLEMQAIAPVHDPLEMDHDITLVAGELRNDGRLNNLSRVAYERDIDPWVITRALANYQRTLIAGWSRYDRFLTGDYTALSPLEQQGLQVFNSAEAGCATCHNGFDLSDHSFRNIGQYMDYADPGRERISLDPADLGKFKVPSLRNVALTAPYMHDGSMVTLAEVVDHFISGGEPHPNRDPAVRALDLGPEEREALLAFLHALTDERPMDPLAP